MLPCAYRAASSSRRSRSDLVVEPPAESMPDAIDLPVRPVGDACAYRAELRAVLREVRKDIGTRALTCPRPLSIPPPYRLMPAPSLAELYV